MDIPGWPLGKLELLCASLKAFLNLISCDKFCDSPTEKSTSPGQSDRTFFAH